MANNLSFAAALLQLRQKTLDRDSPGAAALDAARSRLGVLANVRRRLNDPSVIYLPAGIYLENLCRDLAKASDRPDIQLTVEASSIELDLDGLMFVDLITAELVTNGIKHAFQGRTKGAIAINLDAKTSSLGQNIIKSLASPTGRCLAFLYH